MHACRLSFFQKDTLNSRVCDDTFWDQILKIINHALAPTKSQARVNLLRVIANANSYLILPSVMALLPRCSTSDDVAYLFSLMIGEANQIRKFMIGTPTHT